MTSGASNTENLPIAMLKDCLADVHTFCEASSNTSVASAASKGVGGDPNFQPICTAAEIAQWLSAHTYLLAKEKINVVCPALVDPDDLPDLESHREIIAGAVALLLGRKPESVGIEIAVIAEVSIDGVESCFNGIWRQKAEPNQFGDAIWLGNVHAEILLSFYCFSEDLSSAVYSRVPVGMNAANEVDLAKKLETLRLCGFYTNPVVMENQLTDLGAAWEAYRHDKKCAFDNTSSYILSITGHSNEPFGTEEILGKVDECSDMLEFVDAGYAMSVEMVEGTDEMWNLAPPGTIIKSRFDSQNGERYHVLDTQWMVRMSDGAILPIMGGQDIRGPIQAELPSGAMTTHPGVNAGWMARSIWGEDIFQRVKTELEGKEPMLSRNDIHQTKKSLDEELATMPKKEADAMLAMLATVISDGPIVEDDALTFFHLMEDEKHQQAMEYLVSKPELIDCRDSEGDTPLMKAVELGNTAMVKQLIALNANVEAAAVDGFRAIHIAARNGMTTIADKLLDAGARIESPTTHGWTPLLCALQAGYEGCAKLLVRRGASTKATACGSPMAMAKSLGIKLR